MVARRVRVKARGGAVTASGKSRKKKTVRRRRRATPNDALHSMAAYDRLLRDPCKAPLVHAPYLGTESGYLCRTVENFQLPDTTKTGLTVGSTVPATVQLAICPGNYATNTGMTWAPGSSQPAGTAGRSVFVVTSSAVRKYRPVAACMKWIPSGSYASRAGVVGMGYSSGNVMVSGDVCETSQFLASQLEVAPNGSKLHEVRWLPTADDQNWMSANSTAGISNGTMTLILYNVDATATSTTSATLNGYVEVTIVWEWIPTSTGTAAGGGLSMAPATGTRFTINDHQSTIRDIGAFLLEGVRNTASAVTEGFVMGLSGGVRNIVRRAPAISYVL